MGDGWFPLFVTRDRLAEWVPELGRLRQAAGQRARPLTVAAAPITVVGPDAETARSVAASSTAWYLCAMGDGYARFVSDQGYGAEVRAVRAANPRPNPQRGVVPTEAEILLDEFACTGHPTRSAIARPGSGADIVMVGLPAGVRWPTIEATLRAAAP